jgi:hypothetical protein
MASSLLLFGLCGAAARAIPQDSIVAKAQSADHQEVSVRINFHYDDHQPIHDLYLSKVKSRNVRPCGLSGLRADCYLAEESLLDGSRASSSYGLNLLFKDPLPLIMVQLFGSPSDLNETVPNRRAEAIRSMPTISEAMVSRLGKVTASLSSFDNYHIEQSRWTFEPLAIFDNPGDVLAMFEKLSAARPEGDCENLCAGLIKFVSREYSGYAYCAYAQALGVVGTPFNCSVMYYKSKAGEYVASFASPFIGEGGAGVEGFSCSVSNIKNARAATDGQAVFAEVAQNGLIGIELRSRKLADGRYQLAGKRAFLLSRVLPSTYEYTTAVFTFEQTDGLSATIGGNITITANRRITTDRKDMLELDDKQLDTYQSQVVRDLKTRLQKEFDARVECEFVNP